MEGTPDGAKQPSYNTEHSPPFVRWFGMMKSGIDAPGTPDGLFLDFRTPLNSGAGDAAARTIHITWCRDGFRTNFTEADGTFTDLARARDVAWTLSNDQIAVLARNPPFPNGKDMAAQERFAKEHINDLLCGGLTLAVRRLSNAQCPAWPVGGRWSGVWEEPRETGSLRVDAQGAWREEEGWGTVDRVELVERDGAGRATLTLTAISKGWAWNDAIGRAVAGDVTLYSGGRAIQHEYLNDAGIDPRPAAELLAVPRFHSQDAFRGEVRVGSLADYTGGGLRVQPIGADGALGEVIEQGLAQDDAKRSLERTGHVLLVVVMTAVACVLLHKWRIAGLSRQALARGRPTG